jgi:hypothetical protein
MFAGLRGDGRFSIMLSTSLSALLSSLRQSTRMVYIYPTFAHSALSIAPTTLIV